MEIQFCVLNGLCFFPRFLPSSTETTKGEKGLFLSIWTLTWFPSHRLEAPSTYRKITEHLLVYCSRTKVSQRQNLCWQNFIEQYSSHILKVWWSASPLHCYRLCCSSCYTECYTKGILLPLNSKTRFIFHNHCTK